MIMEVEKEIIGELATEVVEAAAPTVVDVEQPSTSTATPVEEPQASPAPAAPSPRSSTAQESSSPTITFDSSNVAKNIEFIRNFKSLVLKAKGTAAQAYLLSETAKDDLPFGYLVLCLDGSEDMVSETLEVFLLIGESKENHIFLQQVPFFMDALRKITMENYSEELRERAERLLTVVRDAKKSHHEALAEISKNVAAASGAMKNLVIKKPAEDKREAKGILKKSKAKTTVLYIPSVPIKNHRNVITSTIIKIKGIVSLTYDVNKSHCIIKAKASVHPEDLGKSIANLGYETHLLTRNEKNEEVRIAIEPEYMRTNSSRLDQENLPSYLSDTDEEAEVGANAVAKNGSKKEEKGGWWNSASSYLSKSLYW